VHALQEGMPDANVNQTVGDNHTLSQMTTTSEVGMNVY
jgi:hypothetical protein